MNDVRYMISEAAKLVDVEQHTLRYWEEELELDIPRNEMGHRYYRDKDIKVLKAVKAFKEKGYQLRAIKMIIPELEVKDVYTPDEVEELQKTYDNQNLENETDEDILAPLSINSNNITGEVDSVINGDKSIDKLEQFRTIMKELVTEVLEDNNGNLVEAINEEVSNSVIKEIDYLLRLKEEREEERFQQFDRTLRQVQISREESAASGFFKRKKRKTIFYR
ncbi:MAG: MerR family transcriptional regulator [Clostridiales bacterium]|nr:MerR family transcriptional regulator [Clostridiales bacterium]